MGLLVLLLLAAPRVSLGAAPGDALDAVVQVSARVPSDARTADSLGQHRVGSGVLIDDSGLILTIGYLILEAREIEVEGGDAEPVPADLVAYDHESGFGLIRAIGSVGGTPVALGSAEDVLPRQPLLAVSRAGGLDAVGVYAVDRRPFAGYWEYLLEDAIFTSPPHEQFGGAALFDQDGRLIGIGSLFVNDAAGGGRPLPGNMFVPVDHLKPILADLLADGRRRDPPRPWLGASFEEHRGRVFVTRVTPGGPAAGAGLTTNDIVLGVDGEAVEGLADFYRHLWGRGNAGTLVELDLLKGMAVEQIPVQSGDRYRWLKLRPDF
ncbi:MAG TPA: S1C family serine protease [Geminicoccaceae bacterium]